jgi:hypothetical protein
MNKREYERRAAGVSLRAQKTLALIERGRFYMWMDDTNPETITELEQAGLIVPTGRVVVIRSAYVPTHGYKPYKPEEYA